MRFASIGIRAASRSSRADARRRRSQGFTLVEALVALALILAFASALAPYLFQARRIAHVLLRTLLDAPFDRGSLANAAREGEVDGLRWRIVTEPLRVTAAGEQRSQWSAYRVVASVAWSPDQVITAETVRLGRSQ
jgi:prepilin-type N-terminal cleavage/methylation domain-containing protein